jgi:phage recombination protein Bet
MTTTTAQLATQAPSRPTTVTPAELELIRTTVAQGASDAELALYLHDCARQGVHPLDRLLHFTKRGGKYTPIVSIDFMRARAAATGECVGIDDALFTGTPAQAGFAATVTVWRLVQGQRSAFTATARWSEYKPESGHDFMWRRMPFVMLGKVAEALALRKGFPRELASLYAKEELDQALPAVHARQLGAAVRHEDLAQPHPPTDPSPAPDLVTLGPTTVTAVTSAKKKGWVEITTASGSTVFTSRPDDAQQLVALAGTDHELRLTCANKRVKGRSFLELDRVELIDAVAASDDDPIL